MRDADFAAADQYYQRTKHFWDGVHAGWASLYQGTAQVTLNGSSAQRLALRLSDYADQLAEERQPEIPEAQMIREALQLMVVPAANK